MNAEEKSAAEYMLRIARARLGKATIELAEARDEHNLAVVQYEAALSRFRSLKLNPKDIK